jgi:hypothetical protein
MITSIHKRAALVIPRRDSAYVHEMVGMVLVNSRMKEMLTLWMRRTTGGVVY